jgi:hypothetical protein
MRETTRRMRDASETGGLVSFNGIMSQLNMNLINMLFKCTKSSVLSLSQQQTSHYPSPQAFKDRELYKRLGWLGKSKKPEWLKSELPVDVDEMGMELYPKNGDQMWESYKKYSEECGVSYDDDLV